MDGPEVRGLGEGKTSGRHRGRRNVTSSLALSEGVIGLHLEGVALAEERKTRRLHFNRNDDGRRWSEPRAVETSAR